MSQFSLRDTIQQPSAVGSEDAPSQLSDESINRPDPVPPRHSSWVLERRMLRRLIRLLGDPPISIQLWDQQRVSSPTGVTSGRVLIHDRATLWKLFLRPLLQFGEAYAEGRLDVEGDLTQLLTEIYRAQKRLIRPSTASPRRPSFWQWARRNTRLRSRDNVHHHYDLGNDFYRRWLDEQLLYTCAYFSDQRLTLEEAQADKMEHVCRKLQLTPGESVLEAGCGWGALALFMAKHYGVRVRAFNVSREQIVYARERARREGLAQQVSFIDDDWRNMRDQCDVFVSVGMLEHVGVANYGQLGAVMDHCLVPQGRGLIHTIGQNVPEPVNPWIQNRIFPGAYPPSLSEMMRMFEPYRFSVLDVENLRLHYVETLRHWLNRYEQSASAVRQEFGQQFERTWRLYLCGSQAAFESGALQLFQVVFARGHNNQIPWTRNHMYPPAAKET